MFGGVAPAEDGLERVSDVLLAVVVLLVAEADADVRVGEAVRVVGLERERANAVDAQEALDRSGRARHPVECARRQRRERVVRQRVQAEHGLELAGRLILLLERLAARQPQRAHEVLEALPLLHVLQRARAHLQ